MQSLFEGTEEITALERNGGTVKQHPEPNGYTFEVDGRGISHGKKYWRDCINIKMNRQQALDLLLDLANGLNNPEKNEFIVSRCGWLEKEEDGVWPS